MFGDKEKCCCCVPSESQAMIHLKYAEQIMRLQTELHDARRAIRDLSEMNKILSRTIK